MLENPKINIKIKLAALWTSLMFCYIYCDYFELYVPQKVERLLNGTDGLDSPTKLFSAAIALAIPSVMIALSIFLKPTLNKWLNIIFGVLYALLLLLIAINSIAPWYAFYVLFSALESLIAFIIVWNAWKWPKKLLV